MSYLGNSIANSTAINKKDQSRIINRGRSKKRKATRDED